MKERGSLLGRGDGRKGRLGELRRKRDQDKYQHEQKVREKPIVTTCLNPAHLISDSGWVLGQITGRARCELLSDTTFTLLIVTEIAMGMSCEVLSINEVNEN